MRGIYANRGRAGARRSLPGIVMKLILLTPFILNTRTDFRAGVSK